MPPITIFLIFLFVSSVRNGSIKNSTTYKRLTDFITGVRTRVQDGPGRFPEPVRADQDTIRIHFSQSTPTATRSNGKVSIITSINITEIFKYEGPSFPYVDFFSSNLYKQ